MYEDGTIEKGVGNTDALEYILNKINYNSNQIAKEDGYCYIGYDRGMRNCSEIHQGETCMSGDIFPSLEICMFPNLRE